MTDPLNLLKAKRALEQEIKDSCPELLDSLENIIIKHECILVYFSTDCAPGNYSLPSEVNGFTVTPIFKHVSEDKDVAQDGLSIDMVAEAVYSSVANNLHDTDLLETLYEILYGEVIVWDFEKKMFGFESGADEELDDVLELSLDDDN